MGVLRGLVATAGAVLVLVACGHDWERLDPRLGASASVGPGAGGATASSSGVGGAGASGGGAGGSAGEGGSPPWFDPGLTRRRPLTIAPAPGAGTLADFPLLIHLDATRIDYPSTEPGGTDLRFVADDHTTLLAHEIESWKSGEDSFVWVRVSLAAQPSTVWMYYGGAPTSSPVDPHETWSNGFVAVWHLAGNLLDATGNGHDGTGSGNLAPAAGMIGGAQQLDGAEDFIDVAASPAIDGLFATGGTLSAWIHPESSGEVMRGRIVDRSTTTTFGGGWGLLMSDYQTPSSVGFAHGYATTEGWWTTSMNTITYGTWQNVAVTFSDADAVPAPVIYLDGAPDTLTPSPPMGAPPALTSIPTRIGGRAGATDRDFDGRLDEVRMSSVARSAEWTATEVAAAKDTLVDFGAEQNQR